MDVIGGIILILFMAGVLALPMAFIAMLFYLSNMFIAIPLLIAVYAILIVLIGFKTFKWMKQRNGKKIFYGVAVAITVVALSFTISGVYKQTLDSVDNAEVNLDQYMPFVIGTSAVKLDEPATLKLESDLPILDGATALYPVYAGFARAVYPKKEYNLYSSEVMANMTNVAYENLINGAVDLIFVAGPSAKQMQAAKLAGK
jgi:phosphate transport system substrate-binding protein